MNMNVGPVKQPENEWDSTARAKMKNSKILLDMADILSHEGLGNRAFGLG